MCCPFSFFSSSSFAGVIISCSFQIEIGLPRHEIFHFRLEEGAFFPFRSRLEKRKREKDREKCPVSFFIFHFPSPINGLTVAKSLVLGACCWV